MTKKDVCIIGVDTFTKRVAKSLTNAGMKVVLIDNDEEKINNLSSEFTYVYRADATNKAALDDMNIADFDQVIVGVSKMEDSILIVSNLRDLNIKNVIAKVRNEVQKRVLSILTEGFVKIIWPEETMADITSFRLINGIDVNLSLVDKDVSVIKLPVNNHKLFQIEIRDFELKSQYLTNIIMINRGNELIFPVRSTTKLLNGDVVTLACKSNTVGKVVALFTTK